jgi:hypothetical protein
MTRRPCRRCGRNRSERFYSSSRAQTCADCRRTTARNGARRRHVERVYGLSAEDHAALVELQGGVCAICLAPRRYELPVDHDHATGEVRGLICKADNKLLAIVRDDPERLRRAAAYLECPPMAYLAAARTEVAG